MKTNYVNQVNKKVSLVNIVKILFNITTLFCLLFLNKILLNRAQVCKFICIPKHWQSINILNF